MNKKTLSLMCFAAFALVTTTLTADVYHGPSGSFNGIITAVEAKRNSFTVENNDGRVKMFQVSASRKSSLTIGTKVTVSYQDDYQWPLKTTAINGGGYTK